jgi:hypothetical protein
LPSASFGIDGATLYLFFAVIALFFAWGSRQEGRLSLRVGLWTVARVSAAVVGVAWQGLLTGSALLVGVVVLQVVAEAAEKVYELRFRGREDTDA